MILVDIPRGAKTSTQYKNQASLRTNIRSHGILCEHTPLQFGDAAFEGNGPDGRISVGIERKGLHDFLSCMEDASYTGHQRIGMKQMYTVSILIIEGMWRPREEDGMLMESRDGINWFVCRPNGKPIMYSRIRRALISIRYSGVSVNFTRNLLHTAYDICEEFHYHQKKWDDHLSLRATRKLAIPQLNHKPSLVRQWAVDIEDIGIKKSEAAEHIFRKPIKLATADETEWLQVPGIGVPTAIKIVREIHGL